MSIYARGVENMLARDFDFGAIFNGPPLRRRDRLPLVGRRFRRRYLRHIGWQEPKIKVALFNGPWTP